ncbi:hypothetical protein [Dyadobacter psychrotolerans]|uniref:Uncharacterized protein n=1 Tax=Dyadobacter psychrotolerans TaxID=2541721 RepID=A0A4R5E1J6_9BACT|nr:hypothetical protein [Dyadobacter psychrotolerans]TDE17673.1 hypothetical protein E0F88_07225 [Dyadobacter psychrotolerans]
MTPEELQRLAKQFADNEKALKKDEPATEPFFDNGQPKFTEREVSEMEQNVQRGDIKNLSDKLKYNMHQAEMAERDYLRNKREEESKRFDEKIGRKPEPTLTKKEKFLAAFKKNDKQKDHER